MSSSVKSLIKTTPNDKHNYPATNQSHHCWQRYNEYVLCVKKNKGDEDACTKVKQLAWSICPDDLFNEWKEQRAAGTFLGVQEHEPKADHH